jgi:uncharacterized protein YbaA (DUF1428 family)
MAYVDGFVLPVATKNLKAYRNIAKKASAIWLEHGALEYHECAADDLTWAHGVSFPTLAGAKRNETVIFGWAVFKTRAHRDRVNKKVAADPRWMEIMPDPKKMPFDCSRMAYAGFRSIVQASADG